MIVIAAFRRSGTTAPGEAHHPGEIFHATAFFERVRKSARHRGPRNL
jgi:hypothetical protein